MNITVKENKFYDAMVEIERAKVISNTLLNTYFDQKISTPEDLWRLSGYFYDNGRILLETALDKIIDAEEMLYDARKCAEKETELKPVS